MRPNTEVTISNILIDTSSHDQETSKSTLNDFLLLIFAIAKKKQRQKNNF